MPQTASFPPDPGTYVLLIRVAAPLTIMPGRLGPIRLEPGVYVYVGSARGSGGLAARLNRHLRADRKPHWHVDALTAAAPVVEVWYRASPDRLECSWSQMLSNLPGTSEPAPGFGASDCACRTHLYRLPDSTAAYAALDQPARMRIKNE